MLFESRHIYDYAAKAASSHEEPILGPDGRGQPGEARWGVFHRTITYFIVYQNRRTLKKEKNVSKGMKSTHVVPQNGEWAVKKEGSTKLAAVYDTQAQAIAAARSLVRGSCAGQVVVHNVKGMIRLSETYGLPSVQSSPKKSDLGKKTINKAVSTVLLKRLSGK